MTPDRRGHMASYIGRRKFLATFGGAAAAWPVAARAQQVEGVRRIGLLMGVADDREGQARVTALKQGLQELGWTDGRNIQIEIRFAGADADRIRAHAAELVALAPDIIVGQTTPVIRALRQATSSIPIVMTPINNPGEQGFVANLAHPGGNITGFMFTDFQMAGAAVPSAGRLQLSGIRRAGRVDVVWTRALRLVPALSFLCRSHLEGSQAGRSSRSAADEVRTGHQSQDRE